MAKRLKSRYTWSDNLRLLADEGHARRLPSGTSTFDSIPRKDLAAKLGVSTRTLRRWLNEGTTPSPDNQKRIQQAGTGRRRALKRAGYPDLARIPYGHRRQLKNYDFTTAPPTFLGTYRDSEWINYHVAGWSVREITLFLLVCQGYGNGFQILYLMNGLENKNCGEIAGTLPDQIDLWTIDGIEDLLYKLIYQYGVVGEEDKNEILWVGIVQGSRFQPEKIGVKRYK